MSNPRNPRYFPAMKVRGARRRRIAGIQRMAGAFDRFAGSALVAAWALTGFVNTLAQIEERELRARILGETAA